MTLPADKLQGTHVYIKVGDGATPEVFTHPCLINTKRGVKFNSSTQKDIVPDCANPDDPAWESCFVDGLNITVDGAGKLDVSAVATYDGWWQSGAAKNVQIWLGTIGYWQVAMKLPTWSIDGDRNKYAEATLSMTSDGAGSVWTPNT